MLKQTLFACMFITTAAHATDASISEPRYTFKRDSTDDIYSCTDVSGTLEASCKQKTNNFSVRRIKPDGTTQLVENPRKKFFALKQAYEKGLEKQYDDLIPKFRESWHTPGRVIKNEDRIAEKYLIVNYEFREPDKGFQLLVASSLGFSRRGYGVAGLVSPTSPAGQEGREWFKQLAKQCTTEIDEDRTADQLWNEQIKQSDVEKKEEESKTESSATDTGTKSYTLKRDGKDDIYSCTDVSGTLEASCKQNTKNFSVRRIKPDGTTQLVENPRQNFFALKQAYEKNLKKQYDGLLAQFEESWQTPRRVTKYKYEDGQIEYLSRKEVDRNRFRLFAAVKGGHWGFAQETGDGVKADEEGRITWGLTTKWLFDEFEAQYTKDAQEDSEADVRWNEQLKQSAPEKMAESKESKSEAKSDKA